MPCKHFLIQQLVGPETFAAYGEGAWALLHPDLCVTLDQVYEAFGRMTVNNWATGGKFKESGYRLPDSKTGAPGSMHKKGMAADPKPLDVTAHFMYSEILKNPARFPLLTTMENIEFTGPRGWVHLDVRPRLPNQTGIRIVNP